MGQGASPGSLVCSKGCLNLDWSTKVEETPGGSCSSSCLVESQTVTVDAQDLSESCVPVDVVIDMQPAVSARGACRPGPLSLSEPAKPAEKRAGRPRPPSLQIPAKLSSPKAESGAKPPTPVPELGVKASPSSPMPPPEIILPPAGVEFRIRFLNFNMANSSAFTSLNDLHGPGGRGGFSAAMQEPFKDGKPVDVLHTTLVETRLSTTDWVDGYIAQHRHQKMDQLIAQNARREGAQNTKSRMRSLAERIGAQYNGNLKSLLAYSSKDFKEDRSAVLFGRLTEAKVAGIPVPNPKKAFMGKVLHALPTRDGKDPGIRICFIAAHFPMAALAAALEKPSSEDMDTLTECKICFAKTLRRIMLKACKRGLVDEHTILLVQGDLNSRTVLHHGDAKDVLLDLLDDTDMQAALIHELPVPIGQWHEAVEFSECEQLPVTYKFHEQGGGKNGDLRLGDILQQADVASVYQAYLNDEQAPSPMNSTKSFKGGMFGRSSTTRTNERKSTGNSNRTLSKDGIYSVDSITRSISGDAPEPKTPKTPKEKNGMYQRAMANMGDQKIEEFGVAFKKGDFRAYRFPASTDRIIYWAPDALEERLSWQFPRGGYEVNYSQLGSDHRPVTLEAVLSVAPLLGQEETRGLYEGMQKTDQFDLDKATTASASLASSDFVHLHSARSTESGCAERKRRISNCNFEATMKTNPTVKKTYLEIQKEDDEKSDADPDGDPNVDNPEAQPNLSRDVSEQSLQRQQSGEISRAQSRHWAMETEGPIAESLARRPLESTSTGGKALCGGDFTAPI